MEKLTKCPSCEGNNLREVLTCQDYVSTGEEFSIYECSICTLKFTNPRPTEKEIGRYYQSDKYISHAGNEKKDMGFMYKVYDIVRNFSIDKKLRIIKKYHSNGKLLDLGCGMGYFINGVRLDNTFTYDAADVSEEAISYVKNNFQIKVLNEVDLPAIPANTYDVITQWHVLEHVHLLSERMTFLKRVLKPKGTMFIAVPIRDSFDAKYYDKYWDGYDVPRHLLHFNRQSFDLLMKRHNFKIVDELPLLFDSPYISMRSENHKKNKKLAMLSGAIIGIISNLSAVFSKNYSTIMFIVKHEENTK